MALLTDEHVPRVFIATLRSNGYEVLEARAVFGKATDDELPRYSGAHGRLLITHDRRDFSGELSDTVEHAGTIVYTDANYLRDDPEGAVRTLERALSHCPLAERSNELVWLDQ